jgi:hypothetical protein
VSTKASVGDGLEVEVCYDAAAERTISIPTSGWDGGWERLIGGSVVHNPNLPTVIPRKPAWNKGRIVGQKRPLLPKYVWAIRVRLEIAENHRDLALFNTAIDSKLRGCDLVRLKVSDVYAAGQVKERTSILQSKTQKPVRLELMEGTRKSLERWLEDPRMVGEEHLWPGRFHVRFTSRHGSMPGLCVTGSSRSG